LINSAPGLTLICGPSGSGKSRAIVATLDSKPEAFAWMPQRIALMPGTLVSNIVGQSTFDSTLLASAVEMAQLDDVDLSDAIDDSGQGLSGGQMQRVMLARAFYRCLVNPKVTLLLDEPTTSIDYKRAQKIRLQLHGLSEAGRSVIVASHEPVYRELASTVIEVGL
jgi:ATP-binding cassette subfamily C protein CydD